MKSIIFICENPCVYNYLHKTYVNRYNIKYTVYSAIENDNCTVQSQTISIILMRFLFLTNLINLHVCEIKNDWRKCEDKLVKREDRHVSTKQKNCKP